MKEGAGSLTINQCLGVFPEGPVPFFVSRRDYGRHCL